jgi:hypothetical protein
MPNQDIAGFDEDTDGGPEAIAEACKTASPLLRPGTFAPYRSDVETVPDIKHLHQSG